MNWKPLGSLTCLLFSACSAAGSKTESLRVVPNPAFVYQGQTLSFQAMGGSVSESGVQWSVRNSKGENWGPQAGTIDANGVFTPGLSTGAWYQIRATSVADPKVYAESPLAIFPSRLPAAPRAGAELDSGAAIRWVSREGPLGAIRHAPGAEQEAAEVAARVQTALDSLKADFASFDPEALLHGVKLEVFLHPSETSQASRSTTSLNTSTSGDVYSAQLHILPPRFFVDRGDGYYERLLTHELSTIFLERVTRQKGGGWTFFQAPDWFVQGLEEYMSIRHATATQKLRLEQCLQAIKKDPSRVQDGIRVANSYTEGIVLLHFLDREFGFPKVLALLRRNEESFVEAFQAEFGIGQEELLRNFYAWIQEQR